MLFVKNMMFLDGATATLAPDLDILGEMAQIYAYFQQHYGEQIALQLGLDPNERVDFDLDAVKAGFRLGPEYGDTLTYAQVKERREIDPQAHEGSLDAGCERLGEALEGGADRRDLLVRHDEPLVVLRGRVTQRAGQDRVLEHLVDESRVRGSGRIDAPVLLRVAGERRGLRDVADVVELDPAREDVQRVPLDQHSFTIRGAFGDSMRNSSPALTRSSTAWSGEKPVSRPRSVRTWTSSVVPARPVPVMTTFGPVVASGRG